MLLVTGTTTVTVNSVVIPAYTGLEVWLDQTGTYNPKIGGRVANLNNPGIALTGTTFTVGSVAWARAADGAAGIWWELVPATSSSPCVNNGLSVVTSQVQVVQLTSNTIFYSPIGTFQESGVFLLSASVYMTFGAFDYDAVQTAVNPLNMWIYQNRDGVIGWVPGTLQTVTYTAWAGGDETAQIAMNGIIAACIGDIMGIAVQVLDGTGWSRAGVLNFGLVGDTGTGGSLGSLLYLGQNCGCINSSESPSSVNSGLRIPLPLRSPLAKRSP